MKKKKSLKRATGKAVLFTFFLILLGHVEAQIYDNNNTVPQITVNAEPDFGPYIPGTHELFTLELTDLPLHTSEVMYRFIDVDSVQVGNNYTQNGTDLSTSVWQVWLDDYNLPLSPRVHFQISYQTDSVANYYFPFVVYPDTVEIAAAAGFGPFITNNYIRVAGWNTVLNHYNSFTITNLPPRTQAVDFKIVKTDTSTLKTFTVTAPQGQFLQTASWNNVLMTDLPVNTMEFRVIVKCNGGPGQGLLFYKPLSIVIQNPLLTSESGGVALTDSIAPFVHKPTAGHALNVDSVKYALITNGPGKINSQAPHYYRGPYSLNVVGSEPFTIEGWILVDGPKMAANQNKSMSFMRVDSLFDISISSENGNNPAIRLSSLIGGELLEIAYILLANSVMDQLAWHHFAIVVGDPLQVFLIYFDGELLGAIPNSSNYNYVINTYNVNNNLKNKPLIIGGCNGQSKGKTPDLTFIRALDEVRIWNTWRSGAQIEQNMNRSILQDPSLVGYWDFDDARNRLDFVSDESFNNNTGILKSGAILIPENPNLFIVLDTLTLKSSNTATDSIGLYLYDEDQTLISGIKQKVQNHQVSWTCDFTSLPYNLRQLVSTEHFPGCPTGSQQTVYNIHNRASVPIATPMCNWGTYYQSDTHLGNLVNSILVNDFPENTIKVELGLMSGSNIYNADVFMSNPVPYQYSLTLNGTDNYIQTTNQIGAPSTYEISLWFKTTTTAGGMFIGFCDSPDGAGTIMDRKLAMRKDGSLYFSYNYDGVHTDTLFAANKYNDGSWHCVTYNMVSGADASLYVDGCEVDNNNLSGSMNCLGYWVIGRDQQNSLRGEYAEFFSGSLAYISMFSNNKETDHDFPLDMALLNGAHRGNHLYKLDEGGGTTVHDSQGNNPGTLMGTAPNWTKTSKITDLVWQHNMIDKPAGQYTFYAKVYYPGGGESGMLYPLGIYNIVDPMPGHNFSYYLLDGLGYFNEGVICYNWFTFNTDYSGQGNPGWTNNILQYVFMSPDHQVVDEGNVTWTTMGESMTISVDMGDAPPGSWLDIRIGYQTSSQTNIINSFPIPILIRPMSAPQITGDFGPFTQAVAPGTMKQPNTFTILTGEYNDLTKITADFYDQSGQHLAFANGTKINNTTWTITQDMSILAPPSSTMKVSYFLGANQFLALQAGPYKIPINRTKPDWFNFLRDSAFTSIQEYPDSVTFQVTTPFENNNIINNSADFNVPDVVPLIGGSSSSLATPSANVYLKYLKGSSTLVLDEPPDFFQKYVNLGAGNWETLTVGFNYGQSNSYQLDDKGNLIASQNFTIGGSLSSGFSKFEGLITKIESLIKFIENANAESVIVKPSFSLCYTGSFQYSSRVRLMTDSTTGQWGSTGNLNIDANPNHFDAYHNSASYHFYAAALAVEFTVGMEVFEGVASGNFGLDGQINMGFGHSYISIPSFSKKPLKALNFETYCRFYVDALWGWYEVTLWGPKMIYTHNFWNDNMNNCFAGSKKSEAVGEIQQGLITREGLVTSFKPVSSYSAMPLPKPQSNITSSDNTLVFNWLERGGSNGQRALHCRFLDLSSQKFSDSKSVINNFNAPNHPNADKNSGHTSIIVWGQSRHDPESFATSGNDDPLDEFYRSQDIYFAIYDAQRDSIIQSEIIGDDVLTYTSGRTEGNPQVEMLNDDQAMVIWQVVYPDDPQGEIWYALLDRVGEVWEQSNAGPAISGEGIESRLELEATGDGGAVLAWKNTSRDSLEYSTIMASRFDGNLWGTPIVVSTPGEVRCNYFDLQITDEKGALAYTVFIEDPVNGHHELAKIVPWNSGHFDTNETSIVFSDSLNHLQLPSVALRNDGKIALALKRERLAPKTENEKISQVDLFQGDLNDLAADWLHAEAHPYICDTNRQVAELNLAFTSSDKLILLSQEYPAVGVNTPHEVQNGIVFGDPYMNQVLRSFKITDENVIEDVDEHEYFLSIPEQAVNPSDFSNVRCFPNPCTDHTTMVFSLCNASRIKADLCDANGTVIGELIDKSLSAGSYEMELNALLLKPGLYLIKLVSDHSSTSYKLIVSR